MQLVCDLIIPFRRSREYIITKWESSAKAEMGRSGDECIERLVWRIVFRYMGIGLSTKEVSLNRLPGWDKGSYGYHGDDGHSFCSSGSGIAYGPTFTTGDVVGCCVNFLENTCFYTRNGHNIGNSFFLFPTNIELSLSLSGTSFRDIPVRCHSLSRSILIVFV